VVNQALEAKPVNVASRVTKVLEAKPVCRVRAGKKVTRDHKARKARLRQPQVRKACEANVANAAPAVNKDSRENEEKKASPVPKEKLVT
jgi:hypothetical protein